MFKTVFAVISFLLLSGGTRYSARPRGAVSIGAKFVQPLCGELCLLFDAM